MMFSTESARTTVKKELGWDTRLNVYRAPSGVIYVFPDSEMTDPCPAGVHPDGTVEIWGFAADAWPGELQDYVDSLTD